MIGIDMAKTPRVINAKTLLAGLRLRHLGMGFFWACCMLTFRSSGLLPSSIDIVLYSTVLLLLSFGFNIATMVVLSILEYQHPGITDSLPAGAFSLVIIVGLFLLGCAGTSDVQLAFFFAGATAVGVGCGFYWGIWAQTYSHLHPDITNVALPLDFILTVALYFVITAIENFTDIPSAFLIAPLPIISWMLLRRCHTDTRYDRTQYTNQNCIPSIASLWQMLLASAVLSFLFGFLWESTVLILGSVDESHHVPLSIALVVTIVLFFFTLLGRRRWDMVMLSHYGAPIIALSFVLFPIFFASNPILIDSIMNAGFSVLEVLVWVAVTSEAYDHRTPGFILGTVARSTFLLFRLIGVVFGYFLIALSGETLISSIIVSVFAIYAISMLIFLPRHKRKLAAQALENPKQNPDKPTASISPNLESSIEHANQPSHPLNVDCKTPTTQEENDLPDTRKPRFLECCDAVASAYNLSRREAEVLPYLAQGRSAGFIADELYISENTVRTHIKHIIEKTDADSKQSLIDFVHVRGAALANAKAK